MSFRDTVKSSSDRTDSTDYLHSVYMFHRRETFITSTPFSLFQYG